MESAPAIVPTFDLDPFRIDGPCIYSTSGGRSSATLLGLARQAHGGSLPPEHRSVFSNTGKELPETLDFVHELTTRWGDPTWVEYVPKRGGTRADFREVNYETAARNGEPFNAMMDFERYVPNPSKRLCTKLLKVLTIQAWVFAKTGLKPGEYVEVIGIRADEAHRARKLCHEWPDRVFRFPLIEAGITKQDVLAWWAAQPFDLALGPNESNCDLCLSGDTEVVTSEGIRRIADMAGTSPELLVPKITAGVASEVGHFVRAPVRSFGVQRLWRIELTRQGGGSKIVHATADHRWFLAPPKGGTLPSEAVPTSGLRPGQMLRSLFRCPVGQERGDSSVAASARGFVFGDGSVPSGDRPGTLDIYDGPKMEAFGALFDALCGRPREFVSEFRGTKGFHFYGVPRHWKLKLPPMSESRHYLMGWLSGWFAADGCVADNAVCMLHAANPAHLEFARSVCAVLGVQCSAVRSQTRMVTPPQGAERQQTMHMVNINRHHLTADFFRLRHHRERIERAASKRERAYRWSVASVEPTDRVEEVFCATVDGVGAFGLADGLMTGNCFLKGYATRVAIMQNRPGAAQWWIDQEEKRKHQFRKGVSYARLAEFAKNQVRLNVLDDDGTDPTDLGGCGCPD